MLAIAQSGYTYHYLNWIPSERGPMVTFYGKVMKDMKDSEKLKQHQFEILSEILATIDDEEPICTYSLDKNNLIFSINYVDADNPITWDLLS